MPTKCVPTTDAAGRRRFVEVSAEIAAALECFDRNLRRRDALYRKRHKPTKSDVTKRSQFLDGRKLPRLVGFLNIEFEPAFKQVHPRATDAGNPWEGPRYSFSHLVGESRTWAGPDAQWRPAAGGGRVCAACGGAKLEAHQYCLMCDRHGREREAKGQR